MSLEHEATKAGSAALRGFSIGEWAERNGFCRATGYKLIKEGRGPVVCKVGSRSLVFEEADREWRQRMIEEAKAAQAGANE